MISIFEVGARDGLQSAAQVLPVDTRVELIRRLCDAGISRIEVGAMVSPKWVPAMAGSDEVIGALKDLNAQTSMLIPNIRGLEHMSHVPSEIAVFTAATDAFTRANTNCSVDESLERIAQVIAASPVPVRGYVSCLQYCPLSGAVELGAVLNVTERLLEMGCYEVSLGETTGKAVYPQIKQRMAQLVSVFGAERLAGHFHDTYGQGVANVAAALECGIKTFDSSVAALGGCPYAPGAKGNVATEDLVYFLETQGESTGINLEAVAKVGDWISKKIGVSNASRAGAAVCARQSNEDLEHHVAK